jgi:hypothetical protein
MGGISSLAWILALPGRSHIAAPPIASVTARAAVRNAAKRRGLRDIVGSDGIA